MSPPSAHPPTDFAEAVQFEECLIGSIIIDPGQLDSIATSVHRSDFFDDDLGSLFSLMVDLADAGKPIADIKLLTAEIRSRGLDLDAARIAQLFTSVPTAHHLRYYASQVLTQSKVRRTFQIGNQLLRDIQDAEQEPAAVIDETIAALESTSLQPATSHSMEDVAADFVEQLAQPAQRATVMTGLYPLDNVVGGFRPGEMIVIAARPGCGKTSLGWQIAEHAGRQLKPTLFVSLEMTRTELFSRVVCGNSGVHSQSVRRGELSEDQRQTIAAAADDIAPYPIFIHDPAAATLRQIRGQAKLQLARHGLDFLVIDYIGLLRPENQKSPRYEQVSEDSKSIKRLAKELGVPVIALCQLNREADGQQPRLSHLRESGSIEQDADMVILLHRQQSEFSIIVAKNRHGDTGKLDVRFDAQRTRFMDKDYSWQP